MSYSSQERGHTSEPHNHQSVQRKATAQFADQRASLTTQLQQQATMANGPQATAQLAQAELMADSNVQQHKTIQRAVPEEELPGQDQAATAQLAGVEEEEPK